MTGVSKVDTSGTFRGLVSLTTMDVILNPSARHTRTRVASLDPDEPVLSAEEAEIVAGQE